MRGGEASEQPGGGVGAGVGGREPGGGGESSRKRPRRHLSRCCVARVSSAPSSDLSFINSHAIPAMSWCNASNAASSVASVRSRRRALASARASSCATLGEISAELRQLSPLTSLFLTLTSRSLPDSHAVSGSKTRSSGSTQMMASRNSSKVSWATTLQMVMLSATASEICMSGMVRARRCAWIYANREALNCGKPSALGASSSPLTRRGSPIRQLTSYGAAYIQYQVGGILQYNPAFLHGHY